jgi:hypothetical protein
MSDRYRTELTKLRRAELPDGLWERVQEGPRQAPLGPEPRSRVTAAVVAFAVFGLAAILAWQAFRPSHPAQPAGSDTVAVPPRGETSAVFLSDGRPVFVVHHEDGTVSVVDGFSSHRAWGVEELNVWCPSTREFVEAAHEARFDEFGGFASPPAPGGLATFAFEVAETDAVGDPSSVVVGAMRDGTPGGGDSGPDRPPFCPPGGIVGDAELIEVTGGNSGDTGMVVGHRVDPDRVFATPAEVVAAAPTGWALVQATMRVDRDGFVQLCARVVDERCEGGVVVRGVDGIGLYLNVTRFDFVSGYEEPQVWLVRVVDGVIDDPAGFGGMLEPSPDLPSGPTA